VTLIKLLMKGFTGLDKFFMLISLTYFRNLLPPVTLILFSTTVVYTRFKCYSQRPESR